MSGKSCSFGGVVLLLVSTFFSFFCVPAYGDNEGAYFNAILSGYTESVQEFGHVSFSYQMTGTMNGRPFTESTGRVHFDQRNIRRYRVETQDDSDQEAQYETVVAPEWDRFIRVSRDDEITPTVISCLKPENIPSVFRTLGATNILFGRALFHDEFVFLPEVLRSLGPNNVTVADRDQNRKEIRFVHQGYRCRMLLDAESFALVLFENSGGTVSHLCEILEFQNISGLVFPTKFVVTSQMPLGEVTYEYSLSDICFNPLSEEDFRFSLMLPDWTAVYMMDAPQIQYIWLDGRAVVLTDELALDRARGHGFIPGPAEPRFWLVTIGILLILVGGGKLLYDHVKKTRGGA